jgi:hypothetical protein
MGQEEQKGVNLPAWYIPEGIQSREVYTSIQQPLIQSPTFVTLTGSLSAGRYLSKPLTVKIESDDGEFLVSELKYYIHGEGTTVPEAISTFKRIFSGYLDVLSEEEGNLSSYMYEQLEYLRTMIRIE